jgi:hypothetical protein
LFTDEALLSESLYENRPSGLTFRSKTQHIVVSPRVIHDQEPNIIYTRRVRDADPVSDYFPIEAIVIAECFKGLEPYVFFSYIT